MAVQAVHLEADAFLVCLNHALSTEKEEVMGLCIGEVPPAEGRPRGGAGGGAASAGRGPRGARTVTAGAAHGATPAPLSSAAPAAASASVSSERFGAESGKLPMARALRCAPVPRGAQSRRPCPAGCAFFSRAITDFPSVSLGGHQPNRPHPFCDNPAALGQEERPCGDLTRAAFSCFH